MICTQQLASKSLLEAALHIWQQRNLCRCLHFSVALCPSPECGLRYRQAASAQLLVIDPHMNSLSLILSEVASSTVLSCRVLDFVHAACSLTGRASIQASHACSKGTAWCSVSGSGHKQCHITKFPAGAIDVTHFAPGLRRAEPRSQQHCYQAEDMTDSIIRIHRFTCACSCTLGVFPFRPLRFTGFCRGVKV